MFPAGELLRYSSLILKVFLPPNAHNSHKKKKILKKNLN